MELKNTNDQSLISLIADHMEKGFLENIIDMFRHDSGLYPLIGDLIQDERMRVRIGTTALIEELKKLDAENISIAVPNLLPLLANPEPFVRGDAANLLGIIGDRRALPSLEKLLADENGNVRLIAKEAIEEIHRQHYCLNSFAGGDVHIDLGRWTAAELDSIIREASLIRDCGLRIGFLSGFFLGLEYKEATLIGDSSASEVFVLNLSGVDCFTFVDYVEAMRLSDSFEGARNNLQKVRYRNSVVAYESRKHFFTDWAEYNPASVDDLTKRIGGRKIKSVPKMLNRREDGTPLLPGIKSHQRTINYIAPENIDGSVLQKLSTGDYAGIYSTMQGLDVSHVGIIIKDGNTVTLRHASSDRRFRKVIDQDLQEYMSGKPGLIILRPRDYRI